MEVRPLLRALPGGLEGVRVEILPLDLGLWSHPKGHMSHLSLHYLVATSSVLDSEVPDVTNSFCYNVIYQALTSTS